MECIVTNAIHWNGARLEPGAAVVLPLDAYERFRRHGCVVTRAEHEAEAAAQAEADRFVAEAKASAEKERTAMLEAARASAEKARAEAEAEAAEKADDDFSAQRRPRRQR